ncbi:MAG: hypothetical protein ACKO0Z_10135 [Betaproteobacteria bacterium]
MNVYEMFGRFRAIADRLDRNGAYMSGRRTGDAAYDDFLRQVRLNRAALKQFSLGDRKAWDKLVREVNSDLTGHQHRQAIEKRVQSRRASTPPGLAASLKQRQAKNMEAKARRIAAITVVVASLRKQGKKPTIKSVGKQLGKEFPTLPAVKPDTLRKDLKKLKVACQSR